MKPCSTPLRSLDHIPFGTIVHFCWDEGEGATPEERCGTACMVLGPYDIPGLYRVVQIKTFVPQHRSDCTGEITLLNLDTNNHHIAEHQ